MKTENTRHEIACELRKVCLKGIEFTNKKKLFYFLEIETKKSKKKKEMMKIKFMFI